eukprot:TRINITY_DN2734_c1_g1_i5.p1 TRINITY_DN2734_c1_g1~~TRINITY_DN2734_c1_g1_i5.p1  ORF type:complete len:956 (-),score=147.56 TRINITY_DN2734_c1_g1_i5:37-2904(-)
MAGYWPAMVIMGNGQQRRRHPRDAEGGQEESPSHASNKHHHNNGDNSSKRDINSTRKAWSSYRTSATFIYASLAFFYLLGVLILFLSTGEVVGRSYRAEGGRLPSVVPASAPPSLFSEERARVHLKHMVEVIGPRLVGTKANDLRTPAYLIAELEKIKKNAPPCSLSSSSSSLCPKMEIEIQHASGSFYYDWLDHIIINVFTNITNVLVRIGFDHHDETILVNSHFDSAIGSPGAGDAGAGIVSMLEIANALMHSNDWKDARRSVLLSFNGAEESLLQGSHAFVTQHRWAKTARMVLNLESTGTGPAILFQVGSDAFVRAYAATALRPHTAAIAQDIFRTGSFPGDTDYRVFRDYLHVTGCDFAFYRNGYAYHTHLDDMENVVPGSIQHLGGNAYFLLKYLQRADDDGWDKPSTSIFFDIMGLTVVMYSIDFAHIFHYSILVVSVVWILAHALSIIGRRKAPAVKNILTYTAAYASVIVGICLSLILAVIISLLLSYVNVKLTWFGRPLLALALYATPSILGIYIAQIGYVTWRRWSWGVENTSTDQMEHEAWCGILLFFSSLLGMLTFMGLGTSYLFMIWSMGILIGWMIRSAFQNSLNRNLLMIVPLITCIPAWLLSLETITSLLALLLPVMGRAGVHAPSDMVVACLCALLTTLSCTIIIPYIHAAHYSSSSSSSSITITKEKLNKKITSSATSSSSSSSTYGAAIICLLVMYMMTIIYASAIPVPYTLDNPKRIFVQHAMRAPPCEVQDQLERSQNSNTVLSNIIIASADAIPPQFVLNEENKHAILSKSQPSQSNDFYALFPFSNFLGGYKIPASLPPPPIDFVRISIIEEKFDANSNTRYLKLKFHYNCTSGWSTIRFKGPLDSWSVSDEVPSLPLHTHGGYYTIRHVGGYDTHDWYLDLTFEGQDKVLIEISASQFQFESDEMTRAAGGFPSWASPAFMNVAISEVYV